jgi:NAD-dependent dihydropyrimidine dehydrogenase PreA subunit
MNRVQVDSQLCEGCRLCVDACPTDVFRMDEVAGIAVPTYPDDCCACLLCVEDCPTGAITIETRLASSGYRSIYDQLADVVAPGADTGEHPVTGASAPGPTDHT